MITEDRVLSYADLADGVARAAALLRRAGVARGDRVMMIVDDSEASVALTLAAWSIAAIAVPLSTKMGVDEYGEIATDCTPAVAVVSGERPGVADSVARHCPVVVRNEPFAAERASLSIADVAPTEPAVLQYTSGTTGQPKGVVHVHRGLAQPPRMFGRRIGLTRDDRCLSSAKLCFSYGLGSAALLPLAAGASTVMWPGATDARTVLRLIRRHRPTVVFTIPTVYASIVEQLAAGYPADTASVRLFVSAGEPLPPAVGRAVVNQLRTPIVDGLGTTECGYIFLASDADQVGGSLRPVDGCRIRVVDDHGVDVPAGLTGYLYVASASNAPRYWGREHATATTMSGGWTRTGDVVNVEGDGGYRYVGRADDILKVAGQKVAPTEIENVLRACAPVVDIAVVGVAGATGLTTIVAHVEVPPAIANRDTEAVLRRQAMAALPAFKRPTRYEFVDELPRTTTGKLVRHRLRGATAAGPVD